MKAVNVGDSVNTDVATQAISHLQLWRHATREQSSTSSSGLPGYHLWGCLHFLEFSDTVSIPGQSL